MISKDSFTNSIDYERAVAASRYEGVEAISPKFAELCISDMVQEYGVGASNTVGTCEAATECTFVNDKMCGISGTCLKQVVGVSEESSAFSVKK